jgi:hypothetical protein
MSWLRTTFIGASTTWDGQSIGDFQSIGTDGLAFRKNRAYANDSGIFNTTTSSPGPRAGR